MSAVAGVDPTDPAQLRHAFREYEIVVEPEQLDDEEEELAKSAAAMEKATIWDDAGEYLWFCWC